MRLPNTVRTARCSGKTAKESRPDARCLPICIGCFSWLNWNCFTYSPYRISFSFTLRIFKNWIPRLVCALIALKCTAKLLSAPFSLSGIRVEVGRLAGKGIKALTLSYQCPFRIDAAYLYLLVVMLSSRVKRRLSWFFGNSLNVSVGHSIRKKPWVWMEIRESIHPNA